MTALDVTTPQQHAWSRPRPLLTLQVLAQRGRIDRLLANGRSPARDPRLAMRARQLTHPPARTRLAGALQAAVHSIDEHPLIRHRRSEVPVCAPSVRACADEIGDLARALMEPNPRVRGVVLARNLLTDGTGPLYSPGELDRLRNWIWSARSAL